MACAIRKQLELCVLLTFLNSCCTSLSFVMNSDLKVFALILKSRELFLHFRDDLLQFCAFLLGAIQLVFQFLQRALFFDESFFL